MIFKNATKLIFRNVKVIPPLENVHQEGYYHRSFLDTIGRTVIRMTAKNVIDDLKQQNMIVFIL